MDNSTEKGKEIVRNSSIIICGIVRDCAKNLAKNIPVINKLCDLAKNYQVIIFENDSVDKTKQILSNWSEVRPHVYVSLNDFNQATIPSKNKEQQVNPLFSCSRIEKMAKYRNYYLDYIEQNHIQGDYVLVVDMDVNKLFLNDIISSFPLLKDWDAVTANGFSRSFSSRFRRRYHDTFAFIEQGKSDIPKTQQDIINDQYKWAKLKPGMDPVPVVSAFGGLAIYRKEAIDGCRYGVLQNNNPVVECLTEHSFLYHQMNAKGYNRICINPGLRIRYQTQVLNTLKRFFKKRTK